MTIHTTRASLTARPPFSFTHALKFLGAFKPLQGQQSLADQTLTRALSIGDQTVVAQISAVAESEHPALNVTLNSVNPLSADDQQTLHDDIRFYLSLDDDLLPFYQQADERFALVVDYLYGYHQVKFSPRAFEAACWAILSQRNPISVARLMRQRLSEQVGGSLTLNGETYRAFPLPETLAGLSLDELNSAVRNVRKTECILDAARAFMTVDEAWLRSAPYDEVENWLRGIKGIGDWSASFVLLRGLGHVERMPEVEKWLLAAASKTYGSEALTGSDLQRLGQRYGAYVGYWAHYLRAAG